MLRLCVPLALFAFTVAAAQQGTTAAQAPNSDTSYIDANCTAHVTRVVPIPTDLSPQAKATLAQPVSDANQPESLAQRRQGTTPGKAAGWRSRAW